MRVDSATVHDVPGTLYPAPALAPKPVADAPSDNRIIRVAMTVNQTRAINDGLASALAGQPVQVTDHLVRASRCVRGALLLHDQGRTI